MSENLYNVLGVPQDASEEEIQQAYRKQAAKHHPDVSDEDDAEDRFKKIQKAKVVLMDEEKRRQYDQLGHDRYTEADKRGATGGGGRGGAGDPFGGSMSKSEKEELGESREVLLEFSKRWEVPDDLVEELTIQEVTYELSEKQVIHKLYMEERTNRMSFSEADYQSQLKKTTAFSDRYDTEPSSYSDKTVSTLTRDASTQTCDKCNGDLKIKCTMCLNGKIECVDCSGYGRQSCECRNGKIKCDTCKGRGTVSQNDKRIQCNVCHGKGSFQCRECGGRGDYRCRNCGGSGDVTCINCAGTQIISCPTCDANGYVYAASEGEIKYTAKQNIKAVSDIGIPESKIISSEGTHVYEETNNYQYPDEGKRKKIRQTTEYRVVPTCRITYTYDNKQYDLFNIEGSLHPDTYPQSTYRKIAPYAIIFSIIIISVGVYLFIVN